jgi:CDP-glycerol glycerophosphotransferase
MSMPRMSVILVVYREQAYLRECVSSVLGQSFADVELVAIDNASPDHGPEILDDLAQKDSRLRVGHLDQSVSLGEARNLALDSATGDYIWFVETTDLMPEGALASVVARLRETSPEVLLLDYTRVHLLGMTKPGPHQVIIQAAAEADTFALDDRPAVACIAAGVWDKIFRREFLGQLGLQFAPGGFGELTVSYPALLAADMISVLDHSCYLRREPPNAANEPSVHGTPFDVFNQYETVFRFADSDRAAPTSRRRLLPVAMLQHLLSILGGLPEARRAEFFARMSDSYRRHARGDEPTPPGRALRTKVRLVEEGRYGLFRALDRAVHQRRAAPKRLQNARSRGERMVNAGRQHALRRYYRSQLRRPIEPDLAVFAAYWYRGYACNPRAIYEKLTELAPWIRGVWIVDEEHRHGVPDRVPYVVAGSREYYSVIARAKYFVNNMGFPDEVVKRDGTIFVGTHHGVPLKNVGVDQRDSPVARTKAHFERLLLRCERWDYFISPNPFSTPILERAYPTPYETLEVGYPRNDVLVNATNADIERIRKELGIAEGQRAVLYAPTHREYLKGPPPTLDVGRLADELGPDYRVMARAHYSYEDDERLEGPLWTGRVVDVTSHPSVEELCLAADVLVTDYSSVMFDYAVLDRPIVIYAPDWDLYRTLRGTTFDLLAEPPGVVTTSDDEAVEAFRSGAVWSEESAGLRAAFRARFCTLDDGHAAERVVRKVWGLEDEAEAPSVAGDRPNRAEISA